MCMNKAKNQNNEEHLECTSIYIKVLDMMSMQISVYIYIIHEFEQKRNLMNVN